MSRGDSIRILELALEDGLTSFDVSHLYGAGLATGILGEVTANLADIDVWCSIGLRQTNDVNGVFAVDLAPLTDETINDRVANALRELGRPELGTLNVHAFDHTTPIEVTLKALGALKERRLVRRVSFSNLSETEAHAVITADPNHVVDLVQLHGSVLERRLIATSGRAFRDDGRGVACFRTLARGLLTREYTRENPRPADSRSTRGWRLNGYLKQEYLEGLEILRTRLDDQGISPLDFALSWLLNSGAADTAIVGVRSIAQIQEVLDWRRNHRPHAFIEELETLIPHQLRDKFDVLPLDHFER